MRLSRISLADARIALGAGLFRMAGREAYIAALNAARAIIFERMTVAPKQHSTTKRYVHELVHKQQLDIDRDTLDILREGFDVKVSADYGPYMEVPELKAEALVQRAELFVERIGKALEG